MLVSSVGEFWDLLLGARGGGSKLQFFAQACAVSAPSLIHRIL